MLLVRRERSTSEVPKTHMRNWATGSDANALSAILIPATAGISQMTFYLKGNSSARPALRISIFTSPWKNRRCLSFSPRSPIGRGLKRQKIQESKMQDGNGAGSHFQAGGL